MKKDANSNFYQNYANKLASQYNGVAFSEVHKDWLHVIPQLSGLNVLDVGAGSGRDAKALAQMSNHVTAVEPSIAIAEQGKQLTSDEVIWINDSLPNLATLYGKKFDLILVSAVWMHLLREEQHKSLVRFKDLMSTGGYLVITLRHGAFDDGRTIGCVDAEDTIQRAKSLAISLTADFSAGDNLNRPSIKWQTLVFRND